MAVIMVFPADQEPITFSDLSSALQNAVGFPCFPFENGKKLSKADLPSPELSSGALWLEVPETTPEDGEPVVHYEIHPRLDRDEALQGMFEEILNQDDSLDAALNQNSYDVILTFAEEPAAVEAAHCLAYVIGAGTGGAILVPAQDEEDEALWYDSAEDFADAIFGGDDEEDEDEE